MTIPPIAELLSCAKNQMLQKQLKLFSGCGQILLPTLLNTCILIMGGEYMTLELQSFLREQGIVHETSTPAKWLSRTVELDTARKGTIYAT